MKRPEIFDVVLQDWKPQHPILKFITNLQDKIDNGKFNHAMLYLFDGICVQSNWKGPEFIKIDIHNSMYKFRRHPKAKNIPNKELYELVIRYMSERKKYSFSGLYNAGIYKLFEYIGIKFKLGTKLADFAINWLKLKEEINPFCSELCVELLSKASLNTGLNLNFTTPNDLDRNRKLKNV